MSPSRWTVWVWPRPRLALAILTVSCLAIAGGLSVGGWAVYHVWGQVSDGGRLVIRNETQSDVLVVVPTNKGNPQVLVHAGSTGELAVKAGISVTPSIVNFHVFSLEPRWSCSWTEAKKHPTITVTGDGPSCQSSPSPVP